MVAKKNQIMPKNEGNSRHQTIQPVPKATPKWTKTNAKPSQKQTEKLLLRNAKTVHLTIGKFGPKMVDIGVQNGSVQFVHFLVAGMVGRKSGAQGKAYKARFA